MIFFPGEKFSEKAEVGENEPELSLSLADYEGGFKVSAELSHNEKYSFLFGFLYFYPCNYDELRIIFHIILLIFLFFT